MLNILTWLVHFDKHTGFLDSEVNGKTELSTLRSNWVATPCPASAGDYTILEQKVTHHSNLLRFPIWGTPCLQAAQTPHTHPLLS
jgi:hypothetical protein